MVLNTKYDNNFYRIVVIFRFLFQMPFDEETLQSRCDTRGFKISFRRNKFILEVINCNYKVPCDMKITKSLILPALLLWSIIGCTILRLALMNLGEKKQDKFKGQVFKRSKSHQIFDYQSANPAPGYHYHLLHHPSYRSPKKNIFRYFLRFIFL